MMRLRILNDSFNFLNENDDIEIEKEITPSEKNNYSIQIIKNKVNGWLTTICDYFNEIFFGMRPAISNIEQDYNLSRDMSNLFVDTNVNVFVYNSKILNAFTFPGAPQLGRFVNIIWLQQYLGKFGVIISNIIGIIVAVSIGIKLFGAGLTSTHSLEYNSSLNKMKMPIKDVTVYISSGLIESLNNNEIKAVLLHEVGHNTMIVASIISNIITISIGGFNILWLIKYIYDNHDYVKDNSDDLNLTLQSSYGSFYIETLAQLVFIVIICQFISQWGRRRQEVYADEFAIKMGFGSYLESAMVKMNTHYLSFTKPSVIKLNFFDKLIYYYNKVLFIFDNYFFKLFHLGGYPDATTRVNMIHRKTENFDNSDQNIDRTRHIETFIA